MAKRIMCIIISVLMIVSLLPTGVFADSGDDTGGIVEVTTFTTDADSGETTDEDQASPESDGEEETGEDAPVEEADSDEGILLASEDDGETGTSNAVAKIGETTYESLAAAVAAVPTDGTQTTITLTADTTESNYSFVDSGMNVVLDLAGHTVNMGTATVWVIGSLTIKDSTVTTSPSVSTDYNAVTYSSGKIVSTNTVVVSYSNGSVTLESGIVESTAASALSVEGNYDATTEGTVNSKLTINGGYVIAQETAAVALGDGAQLTINGGVLVGKDNAAVAGNGIHNSSTDYSGTTITINNGTLIGHIQTSGYVACGIYHPQDGTLNIFGGTIVAIGGCGILMRGGDLNMTGGTIVTTSVTNSGTDNGAGKVGDSRVVVTASGVVYDYDCGYYDTSNVTVALSGTTSITAAASAISVVDSTGTASTKVSVSGGTYLTTSSGTAVADTSVNSYLADGVELSEDGTVTTSTATVWDGTIATAFDSGTGTSTDPYIIANGAQLAYLAQQVNAGTSYSGCYFQLSADIDLNNQQWTPIGNTTYSFQGYFDGNSKTISNLYAVYGTTSSGKSNVGLFGYTTNGSVSNFNIVNATVSGYLNVGVVAGCPYTSTYSNISVTGNIYVTGFAYVGGAFGKNAYANITNVDVKGSSGSYVTADSTSVYYTYVGGLIGFMGEGNVTVDSCDVEIDVTGSTYFVGGLLGILHYGNTLSNCTYSGTVTLIDGEGTAVGGLVGTVMNRTSNNYITNCTFTGSVYSGSEDVTSTASAYGVYYYDTFDTSSSYTFTATTVTYNEEDVSVTVSSSSLVAMIGSTYYTSLADAVAAANEAGTATTITLVNAATVDSTITVSGDVTIDLSGYTITASTTLFKVSDSGALTVTDSSSGGTITISSSSDVYFVSGAGANSTVTIDSGTISVTSTSGKAVLIWNSSVAISGGTFTVSGADSSSSHGIYAKSGTISGGTLKVTENGTAVAAANLVSGTVSITGGTYNVIPLSSVLADGYGATDNDDGTYTVTNKTVVTLTIGDGDPANYSSIYSALSAANSATSAATITLTTNIELPSTMTFNNSSSQAITLDLAGYSLTTAESFTGSNVFVVKSAFTITDSSKEATGNLAVSSSSIVAVIDNQSTLTLSGGTINFTSSYGTVQTAVIKNESGSSVTMSGSAAIMAFKDNVDSGTKSIIGISDEGGTITLSGGTISVSSSIVDAYAISGNGSTSVSVADGVTLTVSTSASSANAAGIWNAYVSMTGGTVTATSTSGTAYGVYGKQSSESDNSTISGGYVSVSGASNSCVSGSVKVSGGYFSHTPANFLADGSAVYGYSNTTYPYTVAEAGKGVASIGTTQYLTLSEAVAVANSATEATTITLLADVQVDEQIAVTGTVTIDLQGHTIKRGECSYTAMLYVDTNGSLTVDDTSEGIAGTIDGSYVVDGTTYTTYGILTYGSLTVKAGTVTGYYGVRVSASSANLTVDGGTVSGTAYGVYQVSGSTTVSSGSVTGASRGIFASAGTVTVSGGTVSATSTSSYSYGIVQFAGTLNITGGTISGASAYGIQATGTVTIDGSDVSISGPYAGVFFTGSSTTATIKSGTITGTSVGIGVANGATVTVGTAGSESTSDPVITASGSSSHGAEVAGGSSLTINSGKVTGSSCGIFVGEGESDNYTTLTITGGEIKSDSIGVSTNGSQNYTKIVMSGGSIDAAYGMYLPAMNSTTEISGGTITGTATGIEIRAGSLTVSGGTISGSTSEFAYTFNGSGTTVIGAGIAISQHSTNQSVTVTITGGEISGSYGVFEVNTYSTSTSDVKLSISGDSTKVSGTTEAVYSVSLSGDVEGLAEGVTTYASEATTVAISGGSFSTIVDEDYCAEGYVPVTTKNDSDYYAVTTGDTVASITSGEVTTNYITLKKALTAAEDGDTIALEANIEVYADLTASTEGTVTIDLAGKNLTINTGVTLTVASGTTVVIKDSSSAGLVRNNGTISVAGTLDIRDLGYTTETSGAGLLGQQSGQIALASTGTFIVPDAWETYWSSYGAWDPTWSTAAHIFSTVEKGATVYSYGKGWTCTEGFTGTSGYTSSGSNYWTVSGTYLVEYFKTSRGSTDDHTISATESDTWTYPAAVTDNMIFAGWYTDDTCATVYSATSGVAYAKFVTLIGEDGSAAGVINFLGAGLSTEYNDDTSSYSEISIRFGYDIVIPDDCGTDDSYSWLWQWSTGTSTNYRTKVGSATTSLYGKSYTSYVGTTTQFRSNLVISKIPSTSYDTDINSILSVTYKTADGTTVTATDEIRTRNVNEIVSKIEENSDANSTEKAIAAGIKALSTGSSEG